MRGPGYRSLGQCASACKVRGDRSNRCWDMAIFRFFKTAAFLLQ